MLSLHSWVDGRAFDSCDVASTVLPAHHTGAISFDGLEVLNLADVRFALPPSARTPANACVGSNRKLSPSATEGTELDSSSSTSKLCTFTKPSQAEPTLFAPPRSSSKVSSPF